MMKEDKILLNISKIDDIKEYKKLGITNFLFPLKDFSIGYSSFGYEEIENIDGNIYILVNRLLTDEDIDNFLELKIPKNIKGFVIEDTGLLKILNDKGYEVINFQNHLNNNYKTINYWLRYFNSVVISTDITLEEIKCILEKSNKPLILNTFGYPMIMYSRRNLVSNYYRNYGMDSKQELEIEEKISNSKFKLKESKYGTAVFDNKIFDYRHIIKELDSSKIKFYLINTEFSDLSTIKQVILGENVTEEYEGFLNKKTIYRVGDIV